jgi:hypothetical protein
VFSKSNYKGKWKLSGSREAFDAGARRTAPEGGRGPQAFWKHALMAWNEKRVIKKIA